jgi:hypothetical protein
MERKYRLTSLKIDQRACPITAGILSIRRDLRGRGSWDVAVRLDAADVRVPPDRPMTIEMTTEIGVFSGVAAVARITRTTMDDRASSRLELDGAGPLTPPGGS